MPDDTAAMRSSRLFEHHGRVPCNRCVHLGSTWLCRRCTSIAMGSGLAFPLLLAFGWPPFWAIAVAPFPVLADWWYTRKDDGRYSAIRVWCTGFPAGLLPAATLQSWSLGTFPSRQGLLLLAGVVAAFVYVLIARCIRRLGSHRDIC